MSEIGVMSLLEDYFKQGCVCFFRFCILLSDAVASKTLRNILFMLLSINTQLGIFLLSSKLIFSLGHHFVNIRLTITEEAHKHIQSVFESVYSITLVSLSAYDFC